MGLLSFLFKNNDEKIQDFQSRKAIILDVRNKAEYKQGAIKGSKHIALPEISSRMAEIKKWNVPVITCCASGMRSRSAAAILKSNGVEAINGGGWLSLQKKLS